MIMDFGSHYIEKKFAVIKSTFQNMDEYFGLLL
jgi:hypothetical protein